MLLEVKHLLFASATVKSIQDESNTMDCYRIDKVQDNFFITNNNYDDSATIDILFHPKLWEEKIESRDASENLLKVTHNCRFFKPIYVCVWQLLYDIFLPYNFSTANKDKLMLNLIVSRFCRDEDTNVINKYYSSAK